MLADRQPGADMLVALGGQADGAIHDRSDPGYRRGRSPRRASGLPTVDIPNGRQAIQAWRRLDHGTRQEVIRRARHGVSHPDPQVAAIAVGRTRATLWRWAVVAAMGLAVCWVLVWLLSHLIGGLEAPWWLRLVLLLGPVLGGLAALCVQLCRIEKANVQMLHR